MRKEEVPFRVREEKNVLRTLKERRRNGLVTYWIETAF
jgi:hypothetical protein